MLLLGVPVALLVAGAAEAQEITLKPIADARLRYENVDQDGLANEADALTLRLRPGIQATTGAWSVLVEGEATLALIDDHNDGTNGKTAYPLVIDPPNLELNRAQVRYARGDVAATAGRQRIELADQRFVGSAGFRQNEQTFDAVRAQWGKPQGLSADVTYAWSQRTVNGRNGAGARPQAVSGDNLFALVRYGSPIGALTGFAYLIDQDEAAVQGFRLSSQTWGVRFAGSAPLSENIKIGYAASWARQNEWHRNPNDYSADYWLGEASLSAGGFTATGGYEVLGAGRGADGGMALTSFQTPLASYFKWNGWAGKFGTTPPNGLRDLYGTAAHGWKKIAGLDAINLSATYHRFDSDRPGLRYGDELDLLLSGTRGRATVSARYARYRAKGFATDTDKLWVTLEWAL